jgi:hypothetical protein
MPASTTMATRADMMAFMIILLALLCARCSVGSSTAHRGDFAARGARITHSLCTIA